MDRTKCRSFNGYKPCSKNSECSINCSYFEIPNVSILIVHLGAMGAVLRSTSLLQSIKRKYPNSFITWVTEECAKPLLLNNPFVDKVLTITTRDLLTLSTLRFDIGFFIDKSPEIGGILKITQPTKCFGFTVLPDNGAIVPLSSSALELWEIGLSNEKKFFDNKKTEIQLIAEALELPYLRDEYILTLTKDEEIVANVRRKEWSNNGSKIIIGLNTGTSGILPNKTIYLDVWIKIIKNISRKLNYLNSPIQLVLLGGGSIDQRRNEQILQQCAGLDVVASPTLNGLRDGMCSVKAVDMVITGDSLGMHMGIAFKKFVIAWFGPTCAHEIDLFDRGTKIESKLACSPCWKRNCEITESCNRTVDIEQIIQSITMSELLKLQKQIKHSVLIDNGDNSF